ncbi:MAG: serine/threonine protein kinase, partial [Mycobacterium sp.]
VLPFTGLKDPSGLAADAAGDIYLTDGSRIVRLTAGSTKQTVLPVTDLGYTRGVAVGADGDVYVTDYGNDQVVQLAAS